MTAPTTSSSPSPGTATILTLAALVILIAGLRAAGGFFLPVLAAAFIATVSAPILAWLERMRVPRVLAILLTVLLDVGLLALAVVLVGTSLSGFHEAVPRYRDAVEDLARSMVTSLRERGIPIERDDLEAVGDPAWILTVVGDLLRELTEIVSNALLVVLLVVFLLFEMAPGRRKISILVGGPHAHLTRIAESAGKLQRYLVVKTLLSTLTGVLFGGWLAVLGVDFPVLWGVGAFLLNYIPTIGPAIATIPPVVVALLTLGPGFATAAAVGCLTINVVVGNGLEPRLMGEALGLSTLVVFTSMLFWGWLWGPVGALLAVPLTMLLRDALALAEETRWLAVLLGSTDWVEKRRVEWGWPEVEAAKSASDPPGTTGPV